MGRVDSLLVTVDGSQLFGSELTHDLGGRVLTAAGASQSSTFTYDGFGHLTQSKLYLGSEQSREDFERDGFGSATFQHSWPSFGGPTSGPGTAFDKSYNTNAGGSMNSETQTWDYPYHSSEPTGWDSLEGWTSYGYDGRGNLTTRMQLRYEPEWTGTMDPYDEVRRAATHDHHAISYYTADERLRVHQITRDSIYHDEASGEDVEGDPWGAYEEYWYDALGRRVLKRSRQNSPICTDNDRCQSSVERFVWDGDQILWELRTSSGSVDTKDPTGGGYTGQSGSIGYVHAGEIDKPLGMMRNGYPIVLHHNWRGMVEAATDTSGTQVATDVPWPGGRWKSTGQFLDPREVHTWVGSLPMGQADHSGLQYRRNRYYNPESGQFTQQDPIGIAGGLNVYGYAEGDPINFSDPFGLCPNCLWGAVMGMAVEGAIQLGTTGRINGHALGVAAVTGGMSGGLSTVARLGRAAKALGTGLVSVAEGRLKAGISGDKTTLAEDLGNAAFGGLASRAGDLVGQVSDDASRYMRSHSRVLPWNRGFSAEARQEMMSELQKRLEWGLFKGALAGGIIGQGGVAVEEVGIE